MYRIAGLFALLIFAFPTFADLNCSAGELSVQPFSLKFERPYQSCRDNPRSKERECASTQDLTYDILSIGANQLLGQCGLKGSEFKFGGDKLNGTVHFCRGGRENGKALVENVDCETRRSQDGNYDLIVCAPADMEQVLTLAFRSNDRDRKEGLLLVSAPGNNLAITVNQIECGVGRRHFYLNPPRDPSDGTIHYQDIIYR